MLANWIGPLATLLATFVGGFLVIVANWISEKRKERRDERDRSDRNAALMTALFVIRNFVVEALNEFDSSALGCRRRAGGLKSAQKNLDSVIQKSPPEVQYIMSAVFGISLRLGGLISVIENSEDPVEIVSKQELLYIALEEFDIYATGDLPMLSADEIREIVANPEDVPD